MSRCRCPCPCNQRRSAQCRLHASPVVPAAGSPLIQVRFVQGEARRPCDPAQGCLVNQRCSTWGSRPKLTHQGHIPRLMSDTGWSKEVPLNCSHWPALQNLTARVPLLSPEGQQNTDGRHRQLNISVPGLLCPSCVRRSGVVGQPQKQQGG